MQDIHDIKGPIEVTYNYWPLLIFFILLLSIMIYLIYLSLRPKKPEVKPVEKIIERALSPLENALKKLESLKKDNLLSADKSLVFYNRLTSILKDYLLEQYLFNVEAKTSSEIIEEIAKINSLPDFLKQLELNLKNFDYAKYSSYRLSEKDMNISYSLLYDFLISQRS